MDRYKRGLLSGLVFTIAFFVLNYFFSELHSWYFYVMLFLLWFEITSSKWWEEVLISDSIRVNKDRNEE